MAVPILKREELLNLLTLTQILKDSENKLVDTIDLKDQAKQMKLPMREFNNLVKQATIDAEPKQIYELQPFNLPKEISETIKNFGDYLIDENGIKLFVGKNIIEVCPHPLFITQILKDIDNNEEKVKISYYKKHEGWHHNIVVDRYQIATSRGVVQQFAKQGIMANDSNAGYIVKYLCDIEMFNLHNLQVIKAVGTLGKTQYGWVPYSENVVYNQGDKDCERRFKLYKKHGNFEDWRDLQIECFDFTIPKICIATAYSSILCETFGVNPFTVHLWGETGKGKSVAMLAAASIYGYPDIKDGIVYTGNSTANGLEPRLAFLKNMCLFLDELSMQTQEEINRMIYLTMQGQGKARMSQGAKAQDTNYWYLCCLSNAEMPVTNDYSKGGVFNRIIQISPTDKVFGELDMPFVARVFKTNYGFGAPAFIKLLEDPNIVEEASNLRKKYYNSLINNTEDKQANAGSIILTSYELARKYIYKCDKYLTSDELKPFLFTNEQVSQVLRIYEKLQEWVTANINMFDSSDIGFNQKWGKLMHDNTVHILPMRLEEFCKKSQIDIKQFIIGLKQRNLLIYKEGKNTSRVRLLSEGTDKTVVLVSYQIRVNIKFENE